LPTACKKKRDLVDEPEKSIMAWRKMNWWKRGKGDVLFSRGQKLQGVRATIKAARQVFEKKKKKNL